MKKFQLTWALIFMLFCLLLVAFTATFALGQQDTARTKTCTCPCDSAFMRRVAYRIERHSETNDRIFSTLRDYEEAQYALEKRLDSLKIIVRTWSERQQQPKKRKQP